MFLFGRLKWATTIAVAAISLAACGSGSATGTPASSATSSSSQLSGSVYFLVSSATTTRWLSQDGPFFTQYMHKLAPNIHVVIENANHSVSLQQSQVEDAITKGAKAIDLVAVDPYESAGALSDAKLAHVPVIAYDHNVQNGPLTAFDVYNSVQIGALQAAPACKFLVQGPPKTLARIMGNAGEYGTTRYFRGQNGCLNPLIKSGQVKVVCQTYTPNWLPVDAQQEAEACLTKTNNQVSAFLDMNDGTSAGVIAALIAQHLAGKIPVFGGQDANLQAIQYIAQGYQAGTIFKSFKVEAKTAAELTVAAIEHKQLPDINGVYNNGYAKVPTALLTPTYVTTKNISAVVSAGIWTWKQICTGPAATTAVCKAQGL